MPRAGIALGSNLGDRLHHLRSAIDRLRGIAVVGEPFLIAPVYQTPPHLCPPDSPDFYNTVIEFEFGGNPSELLQQTQAIEKSLGRTYNPERNAPRVIDIDLLYLGESLCSNELLALPHPRISQRRFVLQPLADIRPNLILPGHSLSITEMLIRLETTKEL